MPCCGFAAEAREIVHDQIERERPTSTVSALCVDSDPPPKRDLHSRGDLSCQRRSKPPERYVCARVVANGRRGRRGEVWSEPKKVIKEPNSKVRSFDVRVMSRSRCVTRVS